MNDKEKVTTTPTTTTEIMIKISEEKEDRIFSSLMYDSGEESDCLSVGSCDSDKSLAKALNISTQSFEFINKPNVIGHRGAVYHEPENTLEGFKRCAEFGCAAELDVFLLKCGTLVVFHGEGSDENPGSLLGYCGIEGNILDYTAEEARQLIFNPNHPEFPCPKDKIIGSNAFIPTLKEVLEAAKSSGLKLKIELKGPGTPEPTLQLVEEMDMVDQCHFSSFNIDRIARIRELRPQTDSQGNHIYKTGALFKSNIPQNFIDISMKAGASDVHFKYDTCTTERVEEVHANGMGSMAWFRGPTGMNQDVNEKYFDVASEDRLMYLFVMSTGVKQLCVNKPDVLISLLNSF